MKAFARRPKKEIPFELTARRDLPFTLFVRSQYDRTLYLRAEAVDGVKISLAAWSWGPSRFNDWRVRAKARRMLERARRRVDRNEKIARTFREGGET